MTNCFKIKYHWFLIIGMLFLSNYCIGQTFLSIPDSLFRPNGRPFIIKLNPTSSIAEKCTSQTISLDIGILQYLPGSNGPIPLGVVITPVTNNGLTTLTISGIVNDGKQGSSLLMDIAAQFKPGTCDGVTQVIEAITTNIGCNVISEQVGNVTVTSVTPNDANVVIENYSNLGQPYCPRKILKYRVFAQNNGNKGFNLSDLKLNIELDKCVTVLAVYKGGTYETVNPVVTSGSNMVAINFSVPDLLLSVNSDVWKSFDVYFTYPCLNGTASDCVAGTKYISAYLTGNKKDCGVSFTTIKKKTSLAHQVITDIQRCPDANCATPDTGGTGKIGRINYSLSFPCPDLCLQSGDVYAYLGITTDPFLPNYPNRSVIIDVPQGINVLGASNFSGIPGCGVPYVVKYIDAMGNKQPTPFANSLTRKIEFTTDCTISTPETSFQIRFAYDISNLPLPGTNLSFAFKYSSESTVLLEGTFSSVVRSCNATLYLTKQVRKSSEIGYENNYNASAIPGELMVYRQEIANFGTGDTNNVVIDPIDKRLIYAGGFRYKFYYYANSPDDFTPLDGKNSFSVDELGSVSVSVPAIGQAGGTVTLSGFNFPCTRKRLFIEYNVIVKNNVVAGDVIKNLAKISGPGLASNYWQPQENLITIAAFTYVKSKMLVKCSRADEWNESGINVKNGEVVDFKMQFSNAGSTPIFLSELINLRPQVGDLFEFGSNPRKSTLDINYNCDTPAVFKNAVKVPGVEFGYALNSPTMDRDMLCPPQLTGNTPIWIPSCDGANWLKASFPSNFTLLPGDNVEIIYKGRVTGTVGTAYNSFAFKVDNCSVLSANSNTLSIANDNVGVGCNSCTLTNAYSPEMKKLFENLMKMILTRKINGETDAQINGSSPAELLALRPYISNDGGNKIYNFVSTVNAQKKITSVKFSFAANSVNDVTFLEEKGLNYNPEVGAVDPSYTRIDTTLYSSSDQYLTTCRRTLDDNGNVTSECNSKTQVKNIDFCPSRFCSPLAGEIKIGN